MSNEANVFLLEMLESPQSYVALCFSESSQKI